MHSEGGSSSVFLQLAVYHQQFPWVLAGSWVLMLADCCMLAHGTSLSPQEHSVTNFLNIVFPVSNLIFVHFRKPAWKDGSTATCVLAVDNILYIANLGDSRVSRMVKPTAGILISLRALFVLKGKVFVGDMPVAMSSPTLPTKHLDLGGCRVLVLSPVV